MCKKSSKKISTPVPGTPAFKALQKKWYSKLAQEGFKDLEPWGLEDGQLSNRGNPTITDLTRYETHLSFYSYIDAYLEHCKTVWHEDRFLLRCLQKGQTYREITKSYKKRYNQRRSLYTIYYKLQELLKKCLAWNKRSKYGCLYEDSANEDVDGHTNKSEDL